MANLPSSASLGQRAAAAREGASKMEAIASSAVRAADKVGASLIVVYTQSGANARLSSHGSEFGCSRVLNFQFQRKQTEP